MTTHSDPDDGRSLEELDRGVARLPHVDALGRVQGMPPSETTVTYGGTMADLGMLIAPPARFGHDTEALNAEWSRKEKARRAKQHADASRLHRRK